MEGVVAKHLRLFHTYVAKWLPKPVTNPMFVIRCRISHIHLSNWTRTARFRSNNSIQDNDSQHSHQRFGQKPLSPGGSFSVLAIRVSRLKVVLMKTTVSYGKPFFETLVGPVHGRLSLQTTGSISNAANKIVYLPT